MVEKIFRCCKSASPPTTEALRPYPLSLVFHSVFFLHLHWDSLSVNVAAMQSTESLSQHTLGIKDLTEGNKIITFVIKIITYHNGNCFLNNTLV